MSDALVKLFGWRGAVFHGDPSVYARYRWLKKYLLPGPARTLDAGCGSGAFTGFVSIQLANLYLLFGRLHLLAGWAATLPLRLLQPLDERVTNLLRHPYLCIGVVGVKQ